MTPDAYEYYLKGKSTFANRQSAEDAEIARGFYKKAIELDSTFLKAKNALGWSYYRTGELEKALPILNDTLAEAEEAGDQSAIRVSIGGIGAVQYAQGDYENALENMLKALEIVETLGDQEGIADLTSAVSAIYMATGKLDEALELETRSLEIRKELENEEGIAGSYLFLSRIASLQKDNRKALELSQQSHEIYQKLGLKSKLAFSHFNLGLMQREVGEDDEALLNFTHALEIQRDLDENRGANILFNMAHLVGVRGEYDKAKDLCQQSLELFEEQGEKIPIGVVLSYLGQVYFALGDDSKAIECLERSLDLHEQVGFEDHTTMLQRSSYLLLAYRKAGKTYNEDELLELLRDTDEIEYDVYFRVYELTADESYLEQAYQKLLERTSDLNNSENFLTYPVPRKIVDGWESLSTSSPT